MLMLTALGGIYLVNCFTTFRLGNDVVRYFTIKEWLEGGGNVSYHKDNLPLGFPYTLVLLSKLHLCNAFFICLLNCVYLAGSIYFTCKIFRIKSYRVWSLIALVLLNWAVIKNVITPLSDIQYMFLSTGSLYFLHIYFSGRRVKHILFAFLLCALAVFTRSIGICLLLSLIFSLLTDRKKAMKASVDRRLGNVVLFSLGIALFLVVFLTSHFHMLDYIKLVTPYWAEEPVLFFLRSFKMHFTDWGEIMLNTSSFKLGFLNIPFIADGFAIIGLASMLYFLLKLYSIRSAIPVYIVVYLLSYMLIVFCWPCLDARFWVPVLPLLFSIFIQPFPVKPNVERRLIAAWRPVYILFGIIALGYYTWLTFNKEAFSLRHDNGIWKRAYQLYFSGKEIEKTDDATWYPLHLLKEYDR